MPGSCESGVLQNTDGGAFVFVNGGAANVYPRIDRQESFEPVISQAAQFEADYGRSKKGLKKLPTTRRTGEDETVAKTPKPFSGWNS